MSQAKYNHLPYRRVKFNKHKHKNSNWITKGIVRSIKYRDKLNLQLKRTPVDSERHNILKLNLKTYQSILKRLIRDAKKQYSGTSPYGHLTSKKTSPLQSPWLSPKLYSTVQISPCNKVTSALRSLLPSPVGDLNSEVPLYYQKQFEKYKNDVKNTWGTIKQIQIAPVVTKISLMYS